MSGFEGSYDVFPTNYPTVLVGQNREFCHKTVVSLRRHISITDEALVPKTVVLTHCTKDTFNIESNFPF
jgi:hypothetical protein